MPSLARFLKSSRLNIQLLLAILGMYTLVFKFTGPGKSSQFYSVTFMDIFMEKVLLDQKDSNLIEHIRNEMLSHPKPFEKKQNIVKGQHNQADLVDQYLKEMTSGFFVEAGAWDGVYLSNSLFFEKERNWTGILVEPNKEAYKNLTEFSGRSLDTWCLNACLSTSPHPQKMEFNAADVFSGVVDQGNSPSHGLRALRNSLPESMRKIYPMQCLPVYSIIAAATNSKHPVVDYFSLDVEGAELSILETIPWDSITIRTMSIEVQHSNATAIEHLMIKNGFKVIQRVGNVDIIFATNDL